MVFRIEHPQELLNELQYGDRFAKEVERGKGRIPVADYRVAHTNKADNRGVFSFCMCPGGQIVPTSTNVHELCINGMSFSRRQSLWANSGLVTNVKLEDCASFNGEHETKPHLRRHFIPTRNRTEGGGFRWRRFNCSGSNGSRFLARSCIGREIVTKLLVLSRH